MMDMIRGDLAALNVKHDVFFSERSLIFGDHDRVREAIEWLEERGHVYVGTPATAQRSAARDWKIASRPCSGPPPLAMISIGL